MVCDIFFYSHPERIPKVSGVCPRFVQDMSKTFLENSLNHSFWIPFDSFSFLAKTFFKKNRPNACPFQSYCITLPSLEYSCGALRIVWRCRQTEYGGSPSTCFFCPLWRISMDVLADEEVRAAFFVPLRQPAPGGSRDKARTS